MMSQQEKFYIDILSDYKSNFKNHLNIQDNYRTIFSGIFGIGKTTFLKEFFELEEIKQEYEVIHLFPVNYSIATNEDIFELIKFDIFYQLLSKNIEFDIKSIHKDIVAYQFIKENFKDIIFPFLNFIPSVGGSIKEIAEKCIELKNKFTDFNSSVQNGELEEIKEFLKEFSEKKGTIYENDFYSQLITSLIYKLKGENKKVVLIIDDIDRIDPEHIFRLLNVFSAHTDIKGDSSNYNKFDFDRVIFVCDIKNIRSIYQTKFGINTDFNGYIDKFYSKKVFEFRIAEILNNFNEKIVENIHFSGVSHGGTALKYRNHFSNHFNHIIRNLYLNNQITFRDLHKVCSSKVELELYNLKTSSYKSLLNINFIGIQLFDVFFEIYGRDQIKLFKAVDNVKRHSYPNDGNLKYFIEDILLSVYVLDHINEFDINNISETYTFQDMEFKLKYNSRDVECEITNYNGDIHTYFELLNKLFLKMVNFRH